MQNLEKLSVSSEELEKSEIINAVIPQSERKKKKYDDDLSRKGIERANFSLAWNGIENFTEGNKKNMLPLACFFGDLELVEAILEKKQFNQIILPIDDNAKAVLNKALLLAIISNNEAVTKILFNHLNKLDINSRKEILDYQNKIQENLLYISVNRSFSSTAKLILDYLITNFDETFIVKLINSPNKSGYTPFIRIFQTNQNNVKLACFFLDCIKKFSIENQTVIFSKQSDFPANTALEWAIIYHQTESVEKLVDHLIKYNLISKAEYLRAKDLSTTYLKKEDYLRIFSNQLFS